MASREELVTLCQRLRGERLLVSSEMELLQSLNSEVDAGLVDLLQRAWICRQEQLNLSKLIYSHPDATPQNSCRQMREFEQAKFLESYKKLGSDDCRVSSILRILLNNPSLVAKILNESDLKAPSSTYDLTHILFSSLYGTCVFSTDEKVVLEVLLHLIRLQLVPSAFPRRVLRRGNCAFSKLYKLFTEGLFSAKVFLTAALHDPVMELLSQDELFLDIDPSKAVIRFPPEERLRRFGEDGSERFRQNLEKYRKIIVGKLVSITSKFIDGIREALPHFPVSLGWLVRQLYDLLMTAGRVKKDECSMLCVDLIFTCFICPAVANPEPLGVIADTPISYIARFNLMQVGQILQTLAVMRWEQLDPKLMDLYANFPKDCMSSLLDCLLEGETGTLETLFPSPSEEGETLTRHLALITTAELNRLVSYLTRLDFSQANDDTSKELFGYLKRLPPALGMIFERQTSSTEQQQNQTVKKRGTLSKTFSHGAHNADEGVHHVMVNGDFGSAPEVVIVPLGTPRDPLGLMPEDRYMSHLRPVERQSSGRTMDSDKRTRFMETESVGTSVLETEGGSEGGSLSSSLDEGLTNPEDISTLPDNFSDVAISANVSGRGSPNVSGRDTPLSQHTEQQAEVEVEDTPSTFGGVPVRERNLPALPVTVNKENREDIDEKFGKFGLPQHTSRERHRDETHSMVSDSWSTDVVPSDTEGGESSVLQAPGGIVPAGSLPDVVPPGPQDIQGRLDLIREEGVAGVEEAAAGEAAAAAVAAAIEDRSDTWSMDALASDSEADPPRGTADLADFDDTASDIDPQLAAAGGTSELGVDDETDLMNQIPDAESPNPSFLVPENQFLEPKLAQEMGARDGGRDTLRRQSSGSSIYTKSDVDSEFSKDFGDEGSAFGDSFPSGGKNRDSTPQASWPGASTPARSRALSNNGGKHRGHTTPAQVGHSPVHDDTTPVADIVEPNGEESPGEPGLERQTLGRLSFVLGMDDGGLRTPSGNKGESGGSTNSSEASNEEAVKLAKMKKTGAIPKRKTAGHANSGPGARSHGAYHSGLGTDHHNDGHRRKNIFNTGIQSMAKKMSDAMRHKGGISPFKMSVSRTHDDLAFRGGGDGRFRPQLTHSHSATPLDSDRKNGVPTTSGYGDNSDPLAILDKYKSLPARQPQIVTEPAPMAPVPILGGLHSSEGMMETNGDGLSRPYYDPENLLRCQAFLDMKRKLRVVLSSVDAHALPNLNLERGNGFQERSGKSPREDEFVVFLRLLLSEAINSQQKSLTAQIREVLRCLQIFDQKGQRKLVRVLRDEQRRRTVYLSFLRESRITLLQLKDYLEKLRIRVERDQCLTGECLVEVLTRMFLERRDSQLRQFVANYQTVIAQDEKTDLVERFLASLYDLMSRDPTWRSATDMQIGHAHRALERSLFAQVYLAALYPNGDADVSRDQVFFEYVKKLSELITPTHHRLQVPRELHAECPWPSAQAEVAIINAYKSPRDKLACVVRCCETIENLLKLAMGKPPGADDVTPVLIYVVIMANPPALLSNIQFVNGFFGNRMQGAEAYWWTQFSSAVEMIKTLSMDM